MNPSPNFKAEVENLPFQKALCIKSECKVFKLPSIMSQSFLKLDAFVKEKHITPCGVPFAFYDKIDWDNLVTQSAFKMFLESFTRLWSFHCAIPIEGVASENEEIKIQDYNYSKVAACLHVGPYHKVGESYKKLYHWIQSQGYEALPYSFESYLNDPRQCKKSELQTKLMIPLK